MKKFFIIFLLCAINYSVSAKDEDTNIIKLWSQNVVSPNLSITNVNWFKSIKVNDMFSWAWVYQINIDLPKWIKWENQNLSLSYNSYSTESFNPYGYAWDINLQPITRSTKKWIDNLYKFNDFFADSDDLVLVDSVNNIYKQKNTWTLTKYIFENWTWKVIDTTWNTYFYWNDELSKLNNPDKKDNVFAWYITKKIDSRWNETNYSYFKDINQVYLKEINYVYTDSVPLYKIKFNYKEKETSSTSYRTQFEVKTTKLLSNIQAFVSDKLSKQYDLTYDSTSNVFSHLTKVELNSNWKTFQRYDFSYWTWKDMHLLKNVKTLNWLNIDFTYKPASAYKENWKIANPNLPLTVKTLSNITYTDLITNNKLSEDYSYAWWYYYYNSSNIYDRQYAWFAKVTKKDNLGKNEVYYFHQWIWSYDWNNLWEFQDDISKKWMIYRYELKDNSWTIYDTRITKRDKKLNNDWTFKVLPTQEVEILKDWTTKASLFTYDDYGELIKEQNLWKVSLVWQNWDFEDIHWDEKSITKTYAINLEKNLFNFVSSEAILNKDNNTVAKKEYFYDNLDLWNVDFWDLTDTKSYIDNTNFTEEKNEYNTKWLLVKTINPKWNSTSIEYDQYCLYPTKITNAKWFIEFYTYDYTTWKLSGFIDVNGIQYTYTYDILWRILSESIINDWNLNLKSYVYDNTSTPNSVSQTTYLDKNWDDKVLLYTYLDSFWNQIQSKRKYKEKYITTYIDYDTYGRSTKNYYNTYETTPNFTTDKANLKWETYTYDTLDRVTNINNANWNIRYEYRDLWFTVYNQKNIPITYNYDIYWNLIEVIDSNDINTEYKYDTIWNLTKITSWSWNYERNFIYDMLWRRIEAEELHSIWTTQFKKQLYFYDENSNLKKKTTLWWVDLIYTYDELDRLIKTNSTDTDVSYTYDEWIWNKWKLTWIDKWLYKEKYNYDTYWQLIEDKKIYHDKEYINTYEYPFIWIKTKTTYPDWKSLVYNLSEWVIEWLDYDSKPLTTSIDYNPNFYIEKLVYWNSSISETNTYDYNYNYRLSRKTLDNLTNKLSDITYTYDELNNITSYEELWNKTEFQKTINYSYDDLNRLTNASYISNWTTENLTYTYDNLWNIIYNSKRWNYFYKSNLPERLEKITDSNSLDTNYSYDDNWNIIGENNNTYIYNSRDELISYQNSTWSTISYMYDEWWIRVEKSGSWLLDRYINKEYEEEKSCHNELISASWSETQEICTIKTTKFIDINGKKIATVETVDNNPEKIIYHQEDYLWSSNIDFDENWNTMQIVDYYPYGKLRQEDHTDNYKDKYLYSDKERDTESWLDYFEARYYNSENWRFNSIDRVYWEVWLTDRWQDALSDPQSQNAYSYARNNPIVYVDPSGESSIDAVEWNIWVQTLANALFTVTVATITYIWEKIEQKIADSSKKNITKSQSKWQSNPKVQTWAWSLAPSWWTPWGNNNKKDDKTKKEDNSLSTKLWKFTLTSHAIERMAERKVSKEMVKETIEKWEKFLYKNWWKQLTWFYNKARWVFVWKWDNWITTVINNVKDNYIKNLKSTIWK